MRDRLCTRCGHQSMVLQGAKYRCSNCRSTISKQDYVKLIEFGRETYYYGVQYRRVYSAMQKKYGKITRHYSLQWPSEVMAMVTMSIASGIIGGAAYDAVKFCFAGLFRTIKSEQLSKSASEERYPLYRASDVDEVFSLLGGNDEVANTLIKDIRDYLNGMPKAHVIVRQAIRSSESIRKDVESVREAVQRLRLPKKVNSVYVTRSGRSYHLKKCPRIDDSAVRISRKLASEEYAPCKSCNPDKDYFVTTETDR